MQKPKLKVGDVVYSINYHRYYKLAYIDDNYTFVLCSSDGKWIDNKYGFTLDQQTVIRKLYISQTLIKIPTYRFIKNLLFYSFVLLIILGLIIWVI